MRPSFLSFVCVWAVAVAACGVSGGNSPGVGRSTGSSSTSEACGRREVRGALNTFVESFNQGRFARLDSLFAREPQFQWYGSLPPGRRAGLASRRRDTLISYFRSRHAKRDHLRLLVFDFNGNSGGYGNFSFNMRRSAADFKRGDVSRFIGKGAAWCAGGSAEFIVMNL